MAKSVLKGRVILFGILFGVIVFSSCKSTGAVCPGSGQSKAADFSPFNSNGTPKGRKDKKADNGIVQKKQPKRLNKR